MPQLVQLSSALHQYTATDSRTSHQNYFCQEKAHAEQFLNTQVTPLILRHPNESLFLAKALAREQICLANF